MCRFLHRPRRWSFCFADGFQQSKTCIALAARSGAAKMQPLGTVVTASHFGLGPLSVSPQSIQVSQSTAILHSSETIYDTSHGLIAIFNAPRLLILSNAFWKSSNLKMSVTMPFVLILPLSRYATARGKQKVWEKDPII